MNKNDSKNTISDRLRSASIRTIRINSDVALLCEVALSAADEIVRLRGQLAAARLAIVEYGAHKGECAITDIDDGGLHYYCDCGYEAAIDAAADKATAK